MKRFCFGILWFLVLVIGVFALGSFLAGYIAGAGMNDPESARKAGGAAGVLFGNTYGGLIVIMSFFVATVGSFFGLLPGTKKSKNVVPIEE